MIACWIDAGEAVATAAGDDHDTVHDARLADLVADLEVPAWHADAACREHDPGLWFPARGQDPRPAVRICEGCLVRSECLAWAMEQPDSLKGIWGGTSGRDRRRLAQEAFVAA